MGGAVMEDVATKAGGSTHHFTSSPGKTELVVDLQGVSSLAELQLDVSTEAVRVLHPGSAEPLEILLPECLASISAEGAARFSRKRGQLIVTWQTNTDEIQKVPSKDASAATTPSDADAQASNKAPTAAPDRAYGSLWNANSWHWEEKKCLDLLQAAVMSTMQKCEEEQLKHVKELSGCSIVLKDVVVKGDASFTLRKGKRILCFEVTVAFRWEGRDEFGGALGAKGSGEVREVTQDEDIPSASVKADATFSGGELAKAAAAWMQKTGGKIIAKCLQGDHLSDLVHAAESQRVDAAADTARREQERQKADEAKSTTGELRASLAATQKQQEEIRRVQPAGSIQGSTWNVNAWHWEEKPMNRWAHAWLTEKLTGFSRTMLGGMATATFMAPSVSGDASVSVRKGKPIILFQLQLTCEWAVSGNSTGVGDTKGKLLIPAFTSEEAGAVCKIDVVEEPSVGRRPSGQLLAAFRRDCLPAVRSILVEFAEALREQGSSAKATQ
mmetsp:Transcript_19817/g.46076  ORF Transcript_19817/g.46076 Transcript_19817/m.46076 type:complete len:499 (+) Transcript_19817:62-1558(+)|eukprot:CAMPEP_0178437000 /NCGR_PEP_ID=MMETSP0689_2-20121128/34737_1 /TAXON_ID=160604 /ORGANISM="Amphidinium massartii, Strain CS-259" /LENGTH=498 /DNA_ID=CAMNT_0020059129 /DNA_START=47 /DNA_END=1543 /DNA_ORIENTATION=+